MRFNFIVLASLSLAARLPTPTAEDKKRGEMTDEALYNHCITMGSRYGCSPDQEQNGQLCYPLCKDGYKGVGPVCWKGASSYGRGAGTRLIQKCPIGVPLSLKKA